MKCMDSHERAHAPNTDETRKERTRGGEREGKKVKQGQIYVKKCTYNITAAKTLTRCFMLQHTHTHEPLSAKHVLLLRATARSLVFSCTSLRGRPIPCLLIAFVLDERIANVEGEGGQGEREEGENTEGRDEEGMRHLF